MNDCARALRGGIANGARECIGPVMAVRNNANLHLAPRPAGDHADGEPILICRAGGSSHI